MEVEVIDPDPRPDWVLEKAVAISDKCVFDLIAKEVRRDVDAMNKLAPGIRGGGESVHIDWHESGTFLTVYVEVEGIDGEHGNHTLGVSNRHVIIRKPDESSILSTLLLDATPVWNAGYCVLQPVSAAHEKPLELWEVSRILLEGLFFPA